MKWLQGRSSAPEPRPLSGPWEEAQATHRHHLALRGHEGRPVADPQLGLQRVEVDLQLALLLHLWGLVLAAVVPEVLQLLLHGLHGLLGGPVLQPGDRAADPFQKLCPKHRSAAKHTSKLSPRKKDLTIRDGLTQSSYNCRSAMPH